MAIKLRFALSVLAVIILLGLFGISQAAPGGGDTEITEVLLNYEDGQVSIIGSGFDDGTGTNEPIVTLGGKPLDSVGLVDPFTIEGNIDLVGMFPIPGDYLLVVNPNFRKAKTTEMLLTLGAVGPQGPPGEDGAPGPSADTCDLENRIYAVIPEFVRSEVCGGAGPISAPELLNADGPYSGVQGVEDVWVSFAATAGELLDDQECIDLSGLDCEGFYKAVFTDMGIASLLNYQITATADPGVALFFYSSGDCSAPTSYSAIRQALEVYVSTNGEGTYLPYILSSVGYDFTELLDLWETIGVFNPLVSVGIAGPGGDILGDIYLPEGTLSISATGKLNEQVSTCSNELDLPLP